jgi:hypothetical protein
VAPASFHPTAKALTESPKAAGQWRAR